ncbi:MAG: protein phosphatase 2C domain-containing protein [Candidatus Saccharimonadales bacterium]
MLEVIDVGGATMTKREKAFLYHGVRLDDSIPSGQDALLINKEYSCFAVADGVGMSPRSDIAARAVCDAYLDVARAQGDDGMVIRSTRRSDVERTLRYIHSAALGALATTTFTGLTIHPDNSASYLHVGDSQLVLLRDDELTHYTSEQAREGGYELLNYLGTQPEWADMGYARHSLDLTIEANAFSLTKLEAEWGNVLLRDGDRFALMTDGVSGSGDHDRLSDKQLKRYMHRRLGATACAQLLLQESHKIDDSTVAVIDIGVAGKAPK